MRVLTPVVEIATLARFHARQYLALRRTIALQLVRDDHTGHIRQALEPLAKERFRGLLMGADSAREYPGRCGPDRPPAIGNGVCR